jgi:hypothetical protein
VRRLVPLALVPLALAACGSDSSDKRATTTTAVSAADFVKAGNQVCIASDKRIFKIGRLSRNPSGWKRTAESARQAVRSMQAVKPPSDRTVGFRQMLRFANALALTIQEIHQSLVKGDIDTAAAGQLAAAQLQDKVHQAARRVGLTFCQQALTNWPA